MASMMEDINEKEGDTHEESKESTPVLFFQPSMVASNEDILGPSIAEKTGNATACFNLEPVNISNSDSSKLENDFLQECLPVEKELSETSVVNEET